jgi:hypothetical protein
MAVKKAQAAMEYLVTYGWALLVLFVVVGYLISSGAFSASTFATQECTFQPDLPCSPYVLYKSLGSTRLEFGLTNGLGFPIKVTKVNYTVTNIIQEGKNTYNGPIPTGVIPSGTKMNFTRNFLGAVQPQLREIKTIIVTMEYQNCRGGTCTGNYVTSGRIATMVESG